MKFTTQDRIDILENAISWLVVLAMFVYGAGKIIQFEGAIEVEKTVPELTGMELMWAFYGYSFGYVLIIGLLEIIGGVLILIKKTRVIGCLFTTAILFNIILQDVFYNVHSGALIAVIIYQSCLLLILVMNRKKTFSGFEKAIN